MGVMMEDGNLGEREWVHGFGVYNYVSYMKRTRVAAHPLSASLRMDMSRFKYFT